MDVSRRYVTPWTVALGAIVLLGLILRLKGLHNPLLDHPGWRQGDTAAIARNFATLQFNPLFPQTDYNGPPPNYVELELQIVPFIAALGYKVFGVHEVFGRLISIAFSLGTVVMLAFFGRWLFASTAAGLVAALLFAIFPGSVYYGRTFTPDTTMVFFLTAALFATARSIVDDDPRAWRGIGWGAALLAAAFLAKPVAVVAIVPIVAVTLARYGIAGTLRRPQTWALLAIAFVPLLLYDRFVASIAEWHWASGITRLHVLPSLAAAVGSPAAFLAKLRLFFETLGMLAHTMLGPAGFGFFALGMAFLPLSKTRPLLVWWAIAAAAYAFVVVTVERVDYYLYLVLPLAALAGGAMLSRLARDVVWTPRRIAAAVAALALLVIENRQEVAAYYTYNPAVYRSAKALDATLDRTSLVVMGHYDPSVLYYINRKGWEEDPYLWTPFDEQSAIRKGARYFIAIENNRLRRNVELYAWLQRFPVSNPGAKWPVYETDYTKVLPGAEERWREFRRREKAGLTAGAAAMPAAPAARPAPNPGRPTPPAAGT